VVSGARRKGLVKLKEEFLLGLKMEETDEELLFGLDIELDCDEGVVGEFAEFGRVALL